MRKVIRYIALAILLAIAVVIVVLLLQRTGNRRALARYKVELIAKGEKLKFTEFTKPPSTNAEQIASRQMFATNDRPEIENVPLLMDFVGPGQARTAWRGNLHLEPTNDDEPLLIGDWKKLAEENEGIFSDMQNFALALKNPAPDTGWAFKDDYQNIVAWPSMKPGLRQISIGLAQEVVLNLHEGHFETAISNLNSMIALTQLYRDEPALICDLLRAANASTGLSATWEALQTTNWNEAQLADLEQRWEGVELLEGLERGFLSERATQILVMEFVRNTKTKEFIGMFSTTTFNARGIVSHTFNTRNFWDETFLPLIYRSTGVDEDELLQLEFFSVLLDAVRLLKSGQPASQAESLLKRASERAEMKMENAARFRFMIGRWGVPTRLKGTLLKSAQVETYRRLTITAIALKRYQLKHGSPPPRLEALVPEYLSAVPIDLMSGKALCYRLKADGTFVLYSVGEDGKDDGGDGTPREAGGKFGLWEGRDAVWPMAATVEEEAVADKAVVEKK